MITYSEKIGIAVMNAGNGKPFQNVKKECIFALTANLRIVISQDIGWNPFEVIKTATEENNEKHYINSELCQSCAKCCLQSWIFTDCKDEAVRFSWLDTDKVSVVKVKEGLWKIIFDIPCSMLEYKDGTYYCKRHNGTRPEFCKTYPMNFLDEPPEILELEKKTCPALKEVLNQ